MNNSILEELQSLTIAAHLQTGIPTYYGAFPTEVGGQVLLHVRITIMPRGGEPWGMYGSDSEYRQDGELTLEGLRDQLADWIPRNRKEAA